MHYLGTKLAHLLNILDIVHSLPNLHHSMFKITNICINYVLIVFIKYLIHSNNTIYNTEY